MAFATPLHTCAVLVAALEELGVSITNVAPGITASRRESTSANHGELAGDADVRCATHVYRVDPERPDSFLAKNDVFSIAFVTNLDAPDILGGGSQIADTVGPIHIQFSSAQNGGAKSKKLAAAVNDRYQAMAARQMASHERIERARAALVAAKAELRDAESDRATIGSDRPALTRIYNAIRDTDMRAPAAAAASMDLRREKKRKVSSQHVADRSTTPSNMSTALPRISSSTETDAALPPSQVVSPFLAVMTAGFECQDVGLVRTNTPQPLRRKKKLAQTSVTGT
jgi:hypothetical protein